MTDENRKRNVADALARAREAGLAAEALLAAGLHRDAVSRAYYAAFHHIRALLFARGLEPRSHRGAFQLLHREYMKPGLLPSVAGWQLAGLLVPAGLLAGPGQQSGRPRAAAFGKGRQCAHPYAPVRRAHKA